MVTSEPSFFVGCNANHIRLAFIINFSSIFKFGPGITITILIINTILEVAPTIRTTFFIFYIIQTTDIYRHDYFPATSESVMGKFNFAYFLSKYLIAPTS